MQEVASASLKPATLNQRSSSVCPTVAVTDDLHSSVVIYEPQGSMADMSAKKPSPKASGSLPATPNNEENTQKKAEELEQKKEAAKKKLGQRKQRFDEILKEKTKSISELEEEMAHDDKSFRNLEVEEFDLETLDFMMPEDITKVDPKVVENALLKRHSQRTSCAENTNPYDFLFKKWDADPTQDFVDDTDHDQTKVMYHIQLNEKKNEKI